MVVVVVYTWKTLSCNEQNNKKNCFLHYKLAKVSFAESHPGMVRGIKLYYANALAIFVSERGANVEGKE